LGLSLAEVLTQHRESVTAIFIECSRCDVRLPAGVHLPHVADTPVQPPASSNGHAPEGHQNAAKQSREHQGIISESPPNGDAPPLTAADLPTRIPAGLQLPCAEAWIVDLRPPQLSLLIGKVGLRALADKSLEPLHVALLAERASRLDRGRKTTGEG